tara:strand:+ start:2488 stop:3351 length:864 start_codon:yes stop_codon:yes gene_type:complete
MGFNLPGKSIQSGTSGHRSALKLVETIGTPRKPSNAYGGDRTWEQGQKESKAAGGDLNQTTRDQKAYEKQKKAENPDWNKREDNQWKKRQNTINSSLGSKKVYDVDSEVEKIKDKQVVTDKTIVDKGETKMAKDGPGQTNEKGEKVYGAADDVTKKLNKSEQTTSNKIARQKVRDARKEFGRGSDEVKAAKVNRKETKVENRKMVKTDNKDRKFVTKGDRYDRKITKRKDKGKDTSRLETKKAKNTQKEKEFGESLGSTTTETKGNKDLTKNTKPTEKKLGNKTTFL